MINKGKTSWTQRVALIIFGVAVSLLCIEILLRLGGFIFLASQEYFNKASLRKKNEFRILCLGESTTALGGEFSYPRQLETILNKSASKKTFSVINKGLPATTTRHIVLNAEKYLNQYDPDIVIAMMGINDGAEFFVQEEKGDSSENGIWNYFKTYKLFKTIVLHLMNRPAEKSDEEKKVLKFLNNLEKKVEKAPTSEGYLKLANLYRAAYLPDEALEKLKVSLTLDPKNFEAWGYLGLHFMREGNQEEAIKSFKKMILLSPEKSDKKISGYSYLAEAYKLNGEREKAKQIYLESIQYLPRHPNAFDALGELFLEEGNYEQACPLFKTQIEINPLSWMTFSKLAHCYRKEGNWAASEAVLKMGIQLNPKQLFLYKEMGRLLVETGKFEEAEVVYEKAIDIMKMQSAASERAPLDYSIYGNLYQCYLKQAKVVEAKAIQKILDNDLVFLGYKTRKNYLKLKKLLSERNIPLVAVQYPLRPIDPLKDILGEDVVFVNNQQVFKSAVTQFGYDAVFMDRFAGDFGHCTQKGNFILAENVAKAVLAYLNQ